MNEYDLDKVISFIKYTKQTSDTLVILSTTDELIQFYNEITNPRETYFDYTKYKKLFQVFLTLYNLDTVYEMNYNYIRSLFFKYIDRFKTNLSITNVHFMGGENKTTKVCHLNNFMISDTSEVDINVIKCLSKHTNICVHKVHFPLLSSEIPIKIRIRYKIGEYYFVSVV